jgi:hypothetical protein
MRSAQHRVSELRQAAPSPGSALNLKIETRGALKGTVDRDTLELMRAVLRPIPSAELSQSDLGLLGR